MLDADDGNHDHDHYENNCDVDFDYGSVYWQTVTVCQLEIIGRPCKKYVWA